MKREEERFGGGGRFREGIKRKDQTRTERIRGGEKKQTKYFFIQLTVNRNKLLGFSMTTSFCIQAVRASYLHKERDNAYRFE